MSYSDFKARRGRAVVAASLAAAALGGCQTGLNPNGPSRPDPVTPTEQFAVKVTSAPEHIALAVHPDGLSANQKAALSDFVSRWRSDGGGAVTLAEPAGLVAARESAATAAYVVQLGVPREQVQRVAGPAGAPVALSYARFEARGANCAAAWDDLTATGFNRPYSHFGCAVTANIAAQVANPRDFLAPAVETPADDNRREVVLSKYRHGDITASAKDDQASGKVSDAVQ